MKSHAVFSEGLGIPGVSGEANVSAPARPGSNAGLSAKLPGVVPKAFVDGFNPSGGN